MAACMESASHPTRVCVMMAGKETSVIRVKHKTLLVKTYDVMVNCVAVCCSGCVQGNCTAPDQCSCWKGWTGEQCSIPPGMMSTALQTSYCDSRHLQTLLVLYLVAV